MEKEQIISLIKGRIIDEYLKHPKLDWAEIAARKLYSQWDEFYKAEQSRQADVIKSVCENCGNEVKDAQHDGYCSDLCYLCSR
jgi:hypothetical protein